MELLRAMIARVRALLAVIAFAPTRRMAIAVVAIAPLWLLSGSSVGTAVAALALVALLAALVADVAMLPDAEDVSVRRTLDETIGVGDTIEGRYEIQSHWDRDLRVMLFDELPARFISVLTLFQEV